MSGDGSSALELFLGNAFACLLHVHVACCTLHVACCMLCRSDGSSPLEFYLDNKDSDVFMPVLDRFGEPMLG